MFESGLLKLCSFIDREIDFLAFISDVFLKSLLIILLVRYLIGSVKGLTPNNRHLVWLSGFLCLAVVPFLPGVFESLFAGTMLAPSTQVMTFSVPASALQPQMLDSAHGFDWPYAVGAIYVLVSSFLLLRLLISISRVTRICNSTEYLHGGESIKLLNSLRSRLSISRVVSLGLSESIHSPYSSGLRAPKIVLPITALDWDRSTLESVLIHELSHIKRFDWLTTVICYVMASINWFNPMAWYVLKKMKGEAEYSCDNAVLQSGKSRFALAEDLLKVARGSMNHQRLELSAQFMVDDEISWRIENLLEARTPSGRQRPGFLPALLLITSIVLTACGSTKVITVQKSDFIKKSRLIYSEQPRYPLSALEQNNPGWVLLSFTVDKYGSVESNSIEVDFSQPEGVFDAASISALQKFRFEARKVNNKAMQSLSMRYMFRFRKPENIVLASKHE